MKLMDVIKELCRREGLKREVDAAQMKEIVAHLSDMIREDPAYLQCILRLGHARNSRKKYVADEA